MQAGERKIQKVRGWRSMHLRVSEASLYFSLAAQDLKALRWQRKAAESAEMT
jgi:hypothetical protein